MPAGGGHDKSLDPSTSLRMTHCKAVHFGELSELEATPSRNGVRDDRPG